jgi:hypothetical protein
MFDFRKPDERRALARLVDATEKITVQRWVELTYDDTHPEWRLKGEKPRNADPEGLVLQALAQSRTDQLYHAVTDLASLCLMEGGTLDWQFNSVRSYLLCDNAKTQKTFEERIKDLCPASGDEPSSVRPHVTWKSETVLPSTTKFPWAGKAIPSHSALPGEGKIIAGTRRWDGSRYFALRTRAAGDDPRLINRAAARIQLEATIAVDLARLTTLEEPLRLAPQIDIRGTDRMSHVRLPPMPRLDSGRIMRATSSAYRMLLDDPEERNVKQVAASLRWLSLATTRWSESPTMAATLLYIALETAHNGCVVSHRTRWNPKKREREESCGGDAVHETALDRYIRTLPIQLADEIERYILRKRARQKRTSQSSAGASWMWKVRVARRQEPVIRWANRLMKAMTDSESEDPLLRFHLAELIKLRGRRLQDIRERCADDLVDLRKARNELVHDTDLLLSEQRISYLASLAVEMLLLRIEEVGRPKRSR